MNLLPFLDEEISERLRVQTERLGLSILLNESMEHHRLAQEATEGQSQAPERAMAELRIAMRLLGRASDLLR